MQSQVAPTATPGLQLKGLQPNPLHRQCSGAGKLQTTTQSCMISNPVVFKTYPRFVLVRYGKATDTEMIVIKEEVYTLRSLEPGCTPNTQSHMQKHQAVSGAGRGEGTVWPRAWVRGFSWRNGPGKISTLNRLRIGWFEWFQQALGYRAGS